MRYRGCPSLRVFLLTELRRSPAFWLVQKGFLVHKREVGEEKGSLRRSESVNDLTIDRASSDDRSGSRKKKGPMEGISSTVVNRLYGSHTISQMTPERRSKRTSRARINFMISWIEVYWLVGKASLIIGRILLASVSSPSEVAHLSIRWCLLR